MSNINIDLNFDIEEIILNDYNEKNQIYILNNLIRYTKLTYLECNDMNLKELSELPGSLTYLFCKQNKLKKLPTLPKLLKGLWCSDNELTELQILPNSLLFLYCDYNKLNKLPDLPCTLKCLMCHYNNLIELPDLPIKLEMLVCNDNKLSYPNLEYKTINKINLKDKIDKRMKLLNRTLLLEWSAIICLNPKRIKRLLSTNQICFFDGSFDTI